MPEAKIRRRLERFLKDNPKSEIKTTKADGDDILAVIQPWGDPSLILAFAEDGEDALIEALVNVDLPERLSAIYHTDKHSLEILWTAYRLSKNNSEVFGREFSFRYDGKNYKCRFDHASDRAIAIAEASRPVAPTDTGYRNLPSFANYARSKKIGDASGDALFDAPASFWIERIKLSGDQLIEFLSTLNFYIGYYDDLSPLVMIHQPPGPKGAAIAQVRYPHGKFPRTIIAKTFEPEVLSFWSACKFGEPANKFLYSYRIIEHSAFFHVEASAKASVRKALMLPHALDDVTATTEKVIAAVKASRVEDYHRFEHVVVNCVDPSILWDVVAANIDVFSSPQTFDGGFELAPLVAGASSKPDFMNAGLRNFSSAARKIRNALSHGKEERSAAVISPTSANQEKLRPWASLMSRAAGEVILFQTV